MFELKGDNIEKRISEGNVTVYYYYSVDCKRVVAEIRGLPVSKERINLRYQEGYSRPADENFYITLSVDYRGVPWRFGCVKNTVVRSIGTEEPTKKAQYAHKWAIANEPGGILKSSPRRLKKAQLIFDYFYKIVTDMPLVKRYIDGFEDYLTMKEAQKKEEDSRKSMKTSKTLNQWKKQFKGKPDPLIPLVELVNSA